MSRHTFQTHAQGMSYTPMPRGWRLPTRMCRCSMSRAHLRMDAWMHAWMHGCMHGCMDACMHPCMHGCMYTYTDDAYSCRVEKGLPRGHTALPQRCSQQRQQPVQPLVGLIDRIFSLRCQAQQLDHSVPTKALQDLTILTVRLGMIVPAHPLLV